MSKKILYFSLVDWYWIKQRPQHFAELLSHNHKVSYFSIVSWRKKSGIANTHAKNEMIESNTFTINPNLTIIRKKAIPKTEKFSLLRSINTRYIRSAISKLDKDQNFDTIILTHPEQLMMIPENFLSSKSIIYDCMDNYKEFQNANKENILKLEEELCNKAKLIVISSEDLHSELVKRYGIKEKLHIINNGVDTNIFDVKKIDVINSVKILKESNNKKVGYIGTISEWFDIKTIYECAIKHTKIEFYIIGPYNSNLDFDSKYKADNIIFTGRIPYYSVPNVLNDIDVAIMPFVLNSLVESVNPVKIYEYLAMGKPVLATKYKETTKFGDLIQTYESSIDFETKLIEILEGRSLEGKISEMLSFAHKNSWEARIEQLNELIL